MIYIIRANHANQFELQNYAPISKELDIHVITSLHPLTPITLPHTKLWSPTDLPNFPLRKQIMNRALGGEQWLPGLSRLILDHYHNSNYGSGSTGGSVGSAKSIKMRGTRAYAGIVVHTAETYTPYTHQAVQLRKTGAISHLVCTCWETIPYANEKFARLKGWKKEAYRYVDLFHTPTERAKQALVAEGVEPNKIKVIPYGVDLARFHPPLPGDSLQGRRKTILTVARLEQEKGMRELESVALRLPQYDFVVIGQGSTPPVSPNIVLKNLPYREIHRYYQTADLFFFPSRTTSTWEEQYGFALIEAMAVGLPILTTDSGAIPEVIGEAGIILDSQNVDKMVKTIRNLLTHPDKMKQLSRLALARAKRLYDANATSHKLRALYAFKLYSSS